MDQRLKLFLLILGPFQKSSIVSVKIPVNFSIFDIVVDSIVNPDPDPWVSYVLNLPDPNPSLFVRIRIIFCWHLDRY